MTEAQDVAMIAELIARAGILRRLDYLYRRMNRPERMK